MIGSFAIRSAQDLASSVRPCARNRSHAWSASANRKFSFGITLFLSIPRASKSSRSAFARDALEAFKAAVEAGEMTYKQTIPSRSNPGGTQRTMKPRKKTDPTTRLSGAMLDIDLLAGFISAMGVLVLVLSS